MEELRRVLKMYLDGDAIFSLSALKLQASCFEKGLTVQAAGGLWSSVVAYGITEYGAGKKSEDPSALNVARTRAIDLLPMIGDRCHLIQNTDKRKHVEVPVTKFGASALPLTTSSQMKISWSWLAMEMRML